MNKKLFAGIFAAIFIMTVFFSCLFIAEEINHECSGADCPICAFMEECENTLHRIGSGPISYISSVFPAMFYLALIFAALSEPVKETLVTYKVRMDN